MQIRGMMVWGAVFALVVGLAFPHSGHAVVTLTVSDGEGPPGSTLELVVTLGITEGELVGGTSQILHFTDAALIAADDGFAECAVDVSQPRIQIEDYIYGPPGCTPNQDCTTLQAVLLPQRDPLVAGPLFRCLVSIPAGTEPGVYEITSMSGVWTNPAGTVDTPIEDSTGEITVQAVTPTPVITNTPVPTSTSTPTLTHTQVPATATRTVTPTSPPGAGGDDGCQMGAGDTSNALLALLMPVAGVLVLRRRSR